MADYRTLEDLAKEYRPTMNAELLHSWAQDVVARLKGTARAMDIIERAAPHVRGSIPKSYRGEGNNDIG